MTRRQRNIRFGAEDENKSVKIPENCLYIWDWFFELSGSRRSRTERLSFSDIKAWSDLSGNNLTAFEFEAIRDMDAAFVDAIAKEIAANEERERIRSEARNRLRR